MVRISLFGTPLSPILALGLATCAVAVVDKWTPEGFNWSALDPGPRENWKGLYLNHNGTAEHIHELAVTTGADVRTTEDVTLVVAPWAIGLAWHAFNLVLTGAGLASTINTCAQNEGQADNIFYCITGLLSTIVGVGGEVSAAKKFAQSKGYLGVAANAWLQSGLEQIDLQTFARDLDSLPAKNMTSQKAHNHFVHNALRSLSTDEVDFVGYAPDSHKLARRDSSVHPFAPMFRFNHHKYGPMELTSRDTGEGGVHFTISYAGHPTHHATQEKRDEFYKHERLNEHLMEGRFDSEASSADPGDITFNGADAFGQIESQVECFAGTEWNEGNVLSVQMYDQANHATFGFASIGIFPDNSVDSGLQGFEPQGMPLTGGQNC
ncbi:hypothetical protein CBS63078_2490 [Aspergillus niger]|uniref:Uncharacterized protein n=2 Tax=Aspergillus niger TaxID=5061 RepID=G3Y8X0_ASPNA|nr:hypothetical protein ASPNIDRAFT_44104 [Aspergillus niger ATCC 1015]KAI2823931.1 hypothetical protein CBS133816_8999 [Aspergillus niger]KAI2835042.1 hypothetical protein CBS11350_10309 [Aspergillus niger]KAI2855972.1 hypothetical protein CBS12448_7069 [Aspergillus niger]KAI2871447.1 hypothetical protein CBS13152_10067 [Aspergillus niger]